MNETMRAAVFRGVGRIDVETRPIPSCPPDGLLLKVHFCGICGGDFRNYRNGLKGGVTDQIMGHEIAGEIVEVGAQTTGWHVGDRVALAPDVSCGRCWYCKRGLVNLCTQHKMLGTHFPGGFAQYLALPKQVLEHGFVEPIPDDMSYEHAAFAEAAAGVVACQKRFDISAGQTVLVIGDGPIGCLHVEMARARGARVILAARGKIDQASAFAPDVLVDNHDPDAATAQILAATGGLGADVAILAVPNVQAQSQALAAVRKRGTVIIYGGAPKTAALSELDSNLIHYNELIVTGSFSYSATGLEDALAAIHSRQIHAEKYLGAVISLDELPDALPRRTHTDALKILVDPWKADQTPTTTGGGKSDVRN